MFSFLEVFEIVTVGVDQLEKIHSATVHGTIKLTLSIHEDDGGVLDKYPRFRDLVSTIITPSACTYMCICVFAG